MLCEKAKGIRMLNVSAAIQTPDRMPRRTLSDVGSPPTTPLDADESSARLNAKHNSVYLVWINSYSAMAVFVFYLVSLESWISISLSVGTTILTYSRTMGNENFDGNTMNWTLLSFAVIAPIGSALTMAFSRREMALQQTAFLRSTFFQLYLAHSIWDWNVGATAESGREKSKVNWLEHSDDACQEILLVCKDLSSQLTLPCSTRARHKITRRGMREASHTHAVHLRFSELILLRMTRLSELCEVLKREGLPGNEAARIRHWERGLMEAIEKLYTIKVYRTPQGLRSFSRLFSVLLPPFYAPYYAQLAHDIGSLGTAIIFSIITSLALTSLFETIVQLEDPFVDSSLLDGVDVQGDLADEFKPQLLAVRNKLFKDCSSLRENNV